jgi:hypothetical protein
MVIIFREGRGGEFLLDKINRVSTIPICGVFNISYTRLFDRYNIFIVQDI